MKRQTIYTICAFLLLAIATVGSTYAFFSATTGEDSNVATESRKFAVIYTGGTDLNGPIRLSFDRTDGINTTLHIRNDREFICAKCKMGSIWRSWWKRSIYK